MGASYFIADLHLATDRPECTESLLRFLRNSASQSDSLYILGDLFDYWIGDESLDEVMPAQVAQSLRELGKRNTRVFFMHGNRDFLIGDQFAKAAGLTLLSDPAIVSLYGTRTVLTHGDSLCTDDVEYLRFRDVVRRPEWQSEFLAKPVAERIAFARSVRSESEQAKKAKAAEIMDVSPAAVESLLRQYQFPRLIHGHTHRPAVHDLEVDGHRCQRIVLADWYTQASCLVCDADGIKSIEIE